MPPPLQGKGAFAADRPRGSVPQIAWFLLAVAVLVAWCWVNQWHYHEGSRVRTNVFTGEVQTLPSHSQAWM